MAIRCVYYCVQGIDARVVFKKMFKAITIQNDEAKSAFQNKIMNKFNMRSFLETSRQFLKN